MMTPAFLKRLVTGGALVMLVLIVPGCAKDSFTVATVTPHYSGDANKGGCGWVLEMDTVTWYQAQNMPSQYLIEGSPIAITYKVLNNTPNCTNSLKVKGVLYIHKVNSP